METHPQKRFIGGILCKISKKVFLQELRSGSVYMNRLDFYTKIENQENGDGFLDREEGLVCKDVNLTYEVNGSKFVFRNVSGYMGMATPVFCCSILKIPDLQEGEHWELSLDPRLVSDFSNGDVNEYGVLLISKAEFCHQLQCAADRQNLIYYMGNVRYEKIKNSSENINHFPRAIFRKDPKYSYQNEYRIALQKSIQKPFKFEIGDISEISYLCDLNILKQPICLYVEK